MQKFAERLLLVMPLVAACLTAGLAFAVRLDPARRL